MSYTKLGIWIMSTMIFYGLVNGVNETKARCYQFTWLGPQYNKRSIFMNATCQRLTEQYKGAPCRRPLVASYDGTWPDVEYIWTHHAEQASCVVTRNDVCAQITYYFDGHVDYSTYMCTRGVFTDTGLAINNGCYVQGNGSFTTRVCFCRSVPGGIPCNKATHSPVSHLICVCALILLMIIKKMITK